MKEKDMKVQKEENTEEMRSEYDFDYSRAVRGKYYRRLRAEGSNVIVLDADVARAFRDSDAVNKALRSLLELTQSVQRVTKRPVTRHVNKAKAG